MVWTRVWTEKNKAVFCFGPGLDCKTESSALQSHRYTYPVGLTGSTWRSPPSLPTCPVSWASQTQTYSETSAEPGWAPKPIWGALGQE